MGAWGSGPFDNDPAMDLLVQYEDEGVAALHSVLSEWDDVDDYAEVDLVCATIAIGEIVTACRGAPMTEEGISTSWVAQVVGTDATRLPHQIARHGAAVAADAALFEKVRKNLTPRLLDPEFSETADLWAEASPEDNEAFRARVTDVIARLEGQAQ